MEIERKLTLLILLIIAPFFVFSQERPVLDWAFFKNDRPPNAEHQAYTWSNLMYSYRPTKMEGEKIEFQFDVSLKMDTAKSYFDINRRMMRDTKLLKHEQGHADIAFIYYIKLKQAFAKSTYSKTNYKAEIRSIFDNIFAQMRAEQTKYDDETNHSKEAEAQRKWDLYLENAVLQR
jgi:hypothetical protein